MSYAFIFPGQGSQFVGMGKDLSESFSEAREVFEEVNESLNQNLTKIMFEGSEEDLNLTENTQPALMAVSMAVIAILKKQSNIEIADTCSFVAGHSLGEYSALTATKAFNLADTTKLLKLRGQAMQKAVPVGIGSMAAILGLDFNVVQDITQQASKDEICTTANDNSNGQVVISGHKTAIDSAIKLAIEKGAKRAIILPVSAPSHCSLMQPAADIMAEALAKTDIKQAIIPVVSNITAREVSIPDDIRRLLVEQITGMVRWRESVLWMKEQGVTNMIEIGAGKVLSGLVRRIDHDISCESVGTPEQIEKFINTMNV
ncbi:MAG: ACP S-malonyltransferase [Alphaproteobacteria bacterium]|nr:ACP S-malonyltransferase [Alphaproteobacteria bacterium]